MLDIDFFKLCNNKNGHAKGDECLTLIAQTLQETLRREDDFIGRYGGEEFIVLLPDAHPEAAQNIAENMRVAVANLSETYPDVIKKPITITLGCYSSTGDHIFKMDDLVSKADQALYKGKSAGRNCVYAEVNPKVGMPLSAEEQEHLHKYHRRSTDKIA